MDTGEAAKEAAPEEVKEIEDPLAFEQHMSNVAGFKKLGFWDQLDAMVAHTCHPRVEIIFITIIAFITFFVNCIILCLLFNFGQVLGPATAASFHDILIKTTIAWCSVASFFGIDGMYESPITGYVASTRSWQVGSVKEPFWGLGGLLGFRRNLLDGPVLSSAYVASRLWVCLSPVPSASAVTAYLLATLLLLVLNYSQYIGASGFYHGPFSVYLFLKYTGTPGALSVLQLHMVVLYVGCGLAKMAPWFIQVFNQEWILPPWALCIDLKPLLYKSALPRDNTPSALAAVLGYAAATCEWGAGVLVLLPASVVAGTFLDAHSFSGSAPGTVCSLPVGLGLLIIVSMHAYIVLHLPTFDVWILNILPSYVCYYAFYCAPTSESGFDYAGFAALPPTVRFGLYGFLLFVLFGQCNTDKVSYTNAYRFWAGNWPQAYYVLTKSAMEKIRKGFPREWAQQQPGHYPAFFGDEWLVQSSMYLMFGQFQTAQLCHRVMPRLLCRATRGKSLTDCAQEGTFFTLACVLNAWLMGPTGNCTLRSSQAMRVLQEVCDFEAGEATLIHVHSFQLYQILDPTRRSTTRWEIVDFRDGVVESGRVSIKECLEITHPSCLKDKQA